jgi:hypothetical protein
VTVSEVQQQQQRPPHRTLKWGVAGGTTMTRVDASAVLVSLTTHSLGSPAPLTGKCTSAGLALTCEVRAVTSQGGPSSSCVHGLLLLVVAPVLVDCTSASRALMMPSSSGVMLIGGVETRGAVGCVREGSNRAGCCCCCCCCCCCHLDCWGVGAVDGLGQGPAMQLRAQLLLWSRPHL